MAINRNNYETYFLLYLDGELNVAEQAEVENFLSAHGDLQKEFSLLQYTVQRPSDFIFEPKELLYRKEEKRRVIPIFWVRIAASLLVILAGGWYLIYQLNYQKQANPADGQKLVSVSAGKKSGVLPEKGNPVIQEKTVKNEVLQTATQSDSKKNPDALVKTSGRNQKVNTPAKSTGSAVVNTDGLNPKDIESEEIVMQKSNAGAELQISRKENAEVVSGQVVNTVKAPILTVAVASGNQVPHAGYEQTEDLSRDNAISVIALNDQNKGITSFFKKIGKRMPGNETAENTKKLRVSIFQFSY